MRSLYFIFIFFLLAACNDSEDHPDVSDIEVDVQLQRFEQKFFSIDTNHIRQSLQSVAQEFPRFFPFYINYILQLQINPPMITEESRYEIIKQIISGYSSVHDSIQKKYPDLGWLEEDIEDAFKYVKYYYPAYKVPDIITYLATFDAPGIVLTPGHLGIGLHQYAGKNFSAYDYAEIRQLYPDYISRRFDKEYILSNCMKAVADDIYPDSSISLTLIEQIVEKGKQWYLLDKFLPHAPDSVKTGYTKRQLEWCQRNEGNIWASILTNSPDLYTTEIERVQNYIGEAPYTPYLEASNSSPGNIGQWVGWQIVKKFAEKNQEMSLQELLATPAKELFQQAGYRPK